MDDRSRHIAIQRSDQTGRKGDAAIESWPDVVARYRAEKIRAWGEAERLRARLKEATEDRDALRSRLRSSRIAQLELRANQETEARRRLEGDVRRLERDLAWARARASETGQAEARARAMGERLDRTEQDLRHALSQLEETKALRAENCRLREFVARWGDPARWEPSRMGIPVSMVLGEALGGCGQCDAFFMRYVAATTGLTLDAAFVLTHQGMVGEAAEDLTEAKF